jgi:hypothetical protein
MEIILGLLLFAIVVMFFARLKRTWHHIRTMAESAERVRLRYYFASAALIVVPMLIIFAVITAEVNETRLVDVPLIRQLFFIGWNLSGISGILLALRASLPLKFARDGYGLIVVHGGLLALLYMVWHMNHVGRSLGPVV